MVEEKKNEKVTEEKKEESQESKKVSENKAKLKLNKVYLLAIGIAIAGIIVFYFAYLHFHSYPNPATSTAGPKVVAPQLTSNASSQALPLAYKGPTFVVVEDPKNPVNLSKFERLFSSLENYLGLNFTVTRLYTTDVPATTLKKLILIPAIVMYVPESILQSNPKLAEVLSTLPQLSKEEYLLLPYHPVYGYGLVPMYYASNNISFYFLYQGKLILVQSESQLARFTRYSMLPKVLSFISYMLATNITVNSTKIIDYNSNFTKLGIDTYPALLVQTQVPLKLPGKKIEYNNSSYIYISPSNMYALQNILGLQFIEIHRKPTISQYDPALGNPDAAPVVIFEYLDLYCPYCAKFASETYPEIYSNYISKKLVAYVVKNFLVHPQAKEIQEYLLCVYNVTRNATLTINLLEKLYQLYYANLTNSRYVPPSVDELKSMINNQALWQKIETCVSNPIWNEVILNETKEAESLGISGTPGFVIWSNEKHYGLVFAGAYPYETFKNVIDYLLSQ